MPRWICCELEPSPGRTNLRRYGQAVVGQAIKNGERSLFCSDGPSQQSPYIPFLYWSVGLKPTIIHIHSLSRLDFALGLSEAYILFRSVHTAVLALVP